MGNILERSVEEIDITVLLTRKDVQDWAASEEPDPFAFFTTKEAAAELLGRSEAFCDDLLEKLALEGKNPTESVLEFEAGV